MPTTIHQTRFGLNTFLWIPESWDRLIYRGFIYERDEFGRFVVRAKVREFSL